ncbi:MAG: aspartate/glutamate racemase family protein [Gammaproteobacteria bacterium]
MKTIHVVNPNSTQAVTDGVDAALKSLRFEGGPPIECHTLSDGPPAIESDEDVVSVAQPLCRYMQALEPDAGAFVIACFSDPGLKLARERLRVPVFGMAECGYLSALSRGNKFGVISILQKSVPRHLRNIDALGLSGRLARDLPVELGVLELGHTELVEARLRAVGRELIEEHGAGVLVLGCAGMASYRADLERDLGVPVIEPVQAAVAMAMPAVSN